MEIINSKDLRGRYTVTNTEQLARGTGARFLECIAAHIPGVLIASQWRRKQPNKFQVLIDYENNGGR